MLRGFWNAIRTSTGARQATAALRPHAKGGRSPYEHGTWIPGLQKGVFALFVILILLPWTEGHYNFRPYNSSES